MEGHARQYDEAAERYAADVESNVWNAMYERPATMALLGDVRGRRVLEAGCGSGPLTAWLVDNGAEVTGFDASPPMVELARRRVGDTAELLVWDLAQPLTFAADGSFDVVVASLVLHYVHDWEPVFAEWRRLLAPDGIVVCSTHHPAMDWRLHSPGDYFATIRVTETWVKGGQPFDVSFWRRPLTAMTSVMADQGFVIERLVEPLPAPGADERDAGAAAALRTRPQFIFFRLRRQG